MERSRKKHLCNYTRRTGGGCVFCFAFRHDAKKKPSVEQDFYKPQGREHVGRCVVFFHPELDVN